MTKTRLVRFAAGALVLALFASGCASTAKAGNPGLCKLDDPENRRLIPVPPSLGGLSVALDKKATDKLRKENSIDASYMCDGAVFSLRGGKNGKTLLGIMTLERLTSDAETDKSDFRTRIVGSIGTARKPEDIGGTLVYRTKSNEQLTAVWFKKRFMGILTVREDQTLIGAVDFDRTLIEAVSLDPVQV